MRLSPRHTSPHGRNRCCSWRSRRARAVRTDARQALLICAETQVGKAVRAAGRNEIRIDLRLQVVLVQRPLAVVEREEVALARALVVPGLDQLVAVGVRLLRARVTRQGGEGGGFRRVEPEEHLVAPVRQGREDGELAASGVEADRFVECVYRDVRALREAQRTFAHHRVHRSRAGENDLASRVEVDPLHRPGRVRQFERGRVEVAVLCRRQCAHRRVVVQNIAQKAFHAWRKEDGRVVRSLNDVCRSSVLRAIHHEDISRPARGRWPRRPPPRRRMPKFRPPRRSSRGTSSACRSPPSAENGR